MRKLFLLFIGTIIGSMANSQTTNPELVGPSGESFHNASYQLDWSIGECITATFSQGDYIITQGFHQDKYEIISVAELAPEIDIVIQPNPAENFVSLRLKDAKTDNLKYIFTDCSGKVLQTSELKSTQELIDLSGYAPATYFIQVTENNQFIKSFKIIKK